jgi:hypothetical protein
MNWATTLNDIAEHGASNRYSRVAHVCDDVYMPSELAARLLPPDGYHDGERIVWDLTALGEGHRSLGH